MPFFQCLFQILHSPDMVYFGYKLKGTSSNELFFTITTMYAYCSFIRIDSVSVKVGDGNSLVHRFKRET